MENIWPGFSGCPWRVIYAAAVIIVCSFAACGGIGHPIPSEDHQMPTDPRLPPDAKIIRDENAGTIIFLKSPNLSQSLESDAFFQKLQAENHSGEIAKVFIFAHGREFLLADPFEELLVTAVKTDDLGLTHVKLQQVFKTIPVSDAEITVHLDRQQRVYLVTGRYYQTPVQMIMEPAITSADAIAVALEHLGRHASDASFVRVDQVIYPETDKGPRLAFRVNMPVRADEGWLYFIDAQTGEILEKRATVWAGSGP